MKTEKKLIAYSILAIMIGVASIVPLPFLMSARAGTTPKPWFNFNVLYAYLTPNITEAGITSTGRWYDEIFFNLTLNPEVEDEIADAQLEYFALQVYTDKGPAYIISYHLGTNRTNSFNYTAEAFYYNPRQWFDSNATGQEIVYGWYMYPYNWVFDGSTHVEYTTGSIEEGEVAALREAEVVYIDVRRSGLVTFNGNSTVITPSGEVIQHIQLQKFGNGFLYNTIFPEDQLSQIDPIVTPFKYLYPKEP